MQVTYEQAAEYYRVRLSLTKIPNRNSFMSRCPFHGDGTESLSVNLEKGGLWKCHAGCGEGGLYHFEQMMFPTYDNDKLWEGIEKACGIAREKRAPRERGELEATYQYHDADGSLLFEKLRYKGKGFTQRAPDGNRWNYNLSGIKKVLYHLPEVVKANVVFICEGEKDTDNVRKIDFSKYKGWEKFVVACTTNFDGAQKWVDEYSPALYGKVAIIVQDNDEAGEGHTQQVIASIAPYAQIIKIVTFPELQRKQDASDFLEQFGEEAFIERVRTSPKWNPTAVEKKEKPFFVPLSSLKEDSLDEDDWIIPGVIHKGGKGLIVAAPKAGKSMIALDLAVAITSYGKWFGMAGCKRRVKVGVVSREDGPGMTKKRTRDFARGRNVPLSEIEPLILFNTYEQRSSFSLQKDADVDDIIRWIKHEAIEFCIFDVLNYLHTAQENDNTEMGAVMKVFDRIRLDSGAQVTVIHHTAANAVPGAKRPRGAGAIDSWWDWKISISPTAEDENIKDVHFATKAGRACLPMQIVFQSREDGSMLIAPGSIA